MSKGMIYLLTNTVNGKEYVGQTIDFKKRMKEHRNDRDEIVVEHAITKYSWKNFESEVLEDNISSDELDKKEIEYIAKYDTFHGRGYNCTEGGDGTATGEDNPVHDIDMTGENNPMYDVHITGQDHSFYGREHTPEAKKKMSETTKGMYKGMDNPNAKITKDMGIKIKEEYKGNKDMTQKDLADKYNISRKPVSEIVRGVHWTIEGGE